MKNDPYKTLSFKRTNGPIDDTIDQLMSLTGEIDHPEIVREMIIAALKAGLENDENVDLKLMNTTLKEMRFTSKAFGPYKEVRKVTAFGSARTKPNDPIYKMAQDFGRKLAEAAYMVITGGGPGIMQAVMEGAGPEHAFGVNIRLPFEQRPNPVLEGNPKNIHYKYFFNRKVAFLKEADAIALFPGGFGTLDEAMETLTLVQTGKRNPVPLVLIDEPGGTYWRHWHGFFEKELLAGGYIGESDFHLFELVDSVDDAVEKIFQFYHRYHSLRYVGDKLVIRLNAPVEKQQIDKLCSRFSDILSHRGDMVLSNALPIEADQPEIAHLPRLVVDFNKADFGRLRRLIDAINAC